MTNKKLLEKLQEDMEMRGFSHYTKDSYYRKAKEILEYFGKPMSQVTTKELLQSYRIRMELDCIAIEDACDNVTKVELDELKKSLELMEQAAENNDYLTYIKCNTRFHTIIVEASDNSLLMRFWQQCNVESYMCTSTPLLRENLAELAKRHEVLYEALLQRDKKKATQAAREHLQTLMDEIKRLDSDA